MFGYITVNQPELRFKDFDMYRSFYCGLCRVLKDRYKKAGQMTLTYDCTFLTLLLTALYEPETALGETKCTAHPLQRHVTRINRYTEYAADMNVLLAYHQCLDDWKDEKKYSKAVMSGALKKAFLQASGRYPVKAERIRENLASISECERENERDIDRAAGYFGEITAEVFSPEEDAWSRDLRRMGFYLGKFIYLMDAYEDLEKDRETGRYNPFLTWYSGEGWEERCRNILTMMMAECCRAFERLPIVDYTEILRNILYSGVWLKFEVTNEKRRKKETDS
ncbi:MAG: hypothetical protein HFI93_07105 [Lachnospiraceae bacterium]|nr:hypothetical protein [Lachnospiraceae bacterium]